MLNVMEVAMVTSELICYVLFSGNLPAYFDFKGLMSIACWKDQL